MHEAESQAAIGIGPAERPAEADVAEPRHEARERQPVISEVEIHRQAEAEVGEHAAGPPQLRDGTGTPTDPDKFVHDMAAAIDKIMADPELAKKMGQAGYERARDVFSWESIGDKTVEVYQSVLDEQKK